MDYIIESILVGLYTVFLYYILQLWINNLYISLLVCGFAKHFLGSSMELWTWYCNNGNACEQVLSQDQTYFANTNYLIIDSMKESLAFLVSGTLFSMFINNQYLLFFLIGVSLHIISEHIGLHKEFCRKTCEKEEHNYNQTYFDFV
jgi:hypothetical protein